MVKNNKIIFILFLLSCFYANLYAQDGNSNLLKGPTFWVAGNVSALILPEPNNINIQNNTPLIGGELGLSYEIPIKERFGLSFSLLSFLRGVYFQQQQPQLTLCLGGTAAFTYKWNKTLFSQIGVFASIPRFADSQVSGLSFKLLKNNVVTTPAGNLGLYLHLPFIYSSYYCPKCNNYYPNLANAQIAIGTYFNFNKIPASKK